MDRCEIILSSPTARGSAAANDLSRRASRVAFKEENVAVQRLKSFKRQKENLSLAKVEFIVPLLCAKLTTGIHALRTKRAPLMVPRFCVPPLSLCFLRACEKESPEWLWYFIPHSRHIQESFDARNNCKEKL